MVRRNKSEVKKFVVLSKNNAKKKIIDTIQKAGNFNTCRNYNTDRLLYVDVRIKYEKKTTKKK